MLTQFALASAELAVNRVLSLDSTAQARLAPLAGKVIALACTTPAITLYLIPLDSGLQVSQQWRAPADCSLSAPAQLLLKLVTSTDKSAVLHHPDVTLEGNSALLMELADILQNLELDWEYEVSRWLGPVPTALLSGHLRSRYNWLTESTNSLHLNTADYLAEESRVLVGSTEAQLCFNHIDQLKLDLDRLDARIALLLKRNQKPL
ncbi:MAG: SCP2 sterol-binding domain-containing protein [Pseudomonas sp.]|jgi:ubiquinone biosynthesis protein UbiJ|nr:SCP2 sterol-binding domain-containing protein [Pseudomonas sp.]MDD2222190.1 SCP2 sterol-binding domain-containing protein [Pseudomonas sp.]MDY0413550.1 SCP2 sterol-binding domain-containing protein [Pseudomonas sp.]NLO54366.1 SCP2 domain-containing protein [Gammaproteobacteria bacterium]